MKKFLVALFLLFSVNAYADGPFVWTYAQVAVSACSTDTLVWSKDTSSGSYNTSDTTLCVELNVGATAAMCGDFYTSSTKGSVIAANSSKTFCTNDNLYCCGVGGTTTVNPVASRKVANPTPSPTVSATPTTTTTPTATATP
jgi:hypothetical protein